MAQIIQGQNAVEGWQNGCRAILAAPNNRIRNLITVINRPTVLDPQWLEQFSSQRVGENDSVSVVAKVLFPIQGKRQNETRTDFYARWNSTLKRGRKIGSLHAPWGTYFERLTNFAGTENQLENMILALSNWRQRYEASLVAHTSSPTEDRLRPIGAPCLQYIEVLWREEAIDLVAVYRNHDFLLKALGNFIGLGQLLKFIATESDKVAGTLTCHSVRAYSDKPARLRRLLEQ